MPLCVDDQIRIARLHRFRENLQDARFSGVRTVRDSNGEEVTYRSQAEIEQAIVALDREMAALRGRTSGRIRISTSKGL